MTDVVELFAGPGGWGEGARILGLNLDSEGIEISADAVATAVAAGHKRRHLDVRHASPTDYPEARGLVVSSPCPTFSASGKRSGLGDDYQSVLDVWTSIGWGIDPDEALACLNVLDHRTALLALAGVWVMTMPNLQWVALEQVPSVEYAWVDLAAELYGADWEYVDVQTLEAADFGLPSRRRRTYLVAHRTRPANITRLPHGTLSMADALGWEPGQRVNTRGARRTSGGNEFSADKPAWCITGKARGWYRVSDGLRLTSGEAGLLNGFRPDYPWSGSRSSQFQQAADVVTPVIAASILGAALGVDPRPGVASHLKALYGGTRSLASHDA